MSTHPMISEVRSSIASLVADGGSFARSVMYALDSLLIADFLADQRYWCAQGCLSPSGGWRPRTATSVSPSDLRDTWVVSTQLTWKDAVVAPYSTAYASSLMRHDEAFLCFFGGRLGVALPPHVGVPSRYKAIQFTGQALVGRNLSNVPSDDRAVIRDKRYTFWPLAQTVDIDLVCAASKQDSLFHGLLRLVSRAADIGSNPSLAHLANVFPVPPLLGEVRDPDELEPTGFLSLSPEVAALYLSGSFLCYDVPLSGSKIRYMGMSESSLYDSFLTRNEANIKAGRLGDPVSFFIAQVLGRGGYLMDATENVAAAGADLLEWAAGIVGMDDEVRATFDLLGATYTTILDGIKRADPLTVLGPSDPVDRANEAMAKWWDRASRNFDPLDPPEDDDPRYGYIIAGVLGLLALGVFIVSRRLEVVRPYRPPAPSGQAHREALRLSIS